MSSGRRALLVLATACVTVLLALPCFAGEGGGFDRHKWDLAMRLVNFGIIAFVIYKYGKDPLVKFLAGKRQSVVLTVEELQREKEELAKQYEEQNKLLEQIEEKIAAIKSYYHRLGEDEKQKIMDRAHVHRDHILEDARLRADREFEKAKARFQAEVVELAIELAEERIRKTITVADDRRLVKEYISQLDSEAGHSA